ncbi:hypothetical protein B0H34DRAFT_280344 [Crassisporium funariophilum]|nr:hypothetical protein B0H34DRAFT_280344 [Crassisporium funariophilum]
MFGNNPFAQAGWYNPLNRCSINGSPWRPPSRDPPTFGALPAPDVNPASVLRFEFSSFNPDVLNCIVTGPGNRKFFDITTPTPNVTLIAKPGETIGVINWQEHNYLEATGILSRQRTRDFLKLSSDQRYRTMLVASSGKSYAWIPRPSGIYLYSAEPHDSMQLARLSEDPARARVLLQITTEAVQAGIFELSIIAAILLYSGRNLD